MNDAPFLEGRSSNLETKVFVKAVENSNNGDTLKLPDTEIHFSVGAKRKSYDIMDLETGDLYDIAPNTKFQNVEVFSGKGTHSKLNIAEKYANLHGGNIDDWQHVKGNALIDTDDGYILAEVHWMQCEGIGKFDFFIKRWLE